MNTNNPILVRASSLSDWMDCPRRAATKAFKLEVEALGHKLTEPQNGIAAAIGTATHTGSTWLLEQKMQTGELGDVVEAEHRALTSLKNERELGVSFDDTSPDANTAERQVIRQLKAFRVYIAPTINPVSVEQRLEGTAMEGVILTGQCDISESIAGDAVGERIRDIKTGSKVKAHGAQLGSYSLLRRAHGRVVKAMSVDFIERVKLNSPQPTPQVITYQPEVVERLAWHVLKSVKRLSDEFYATQDIETFLPNPASVLCSPKYCPAFGTSFCSHHAKVKDNG